MIPEAHSAEVITHVCMVHSSVGDHSKLFQQKLRRCNYVTPKNYLDFISTYSKLLEEKDQYILGEKMKHTIKPVPLCEGLDWCRRATVHWLLEILCFTNSFFVVPAQCKHLEVGLDKLKDASEQLLELNVKLAEQKVVLAEKSIACETMLNEIGTNTTVGQWVYNPLTQGYDKHSVL